MTPEKIEQFKHEMRALNEQAMRSGQIAAFKHVQRCIDATAEKLQGVVEQATLEAMESAMRATLFVAITTAGFTMDDLEPRQ
jgi:hypothetical protein